MKVLHVIPSIAPRYGGPSVAVRGMTDALARAGVDVTVATTNADGSRALDVPIDREVRVGDVAYRFFPRTVRGEWKFSWGLTRWLLGAVHRFDVVHVHALFSYATVPGCRAASRSNVPYVLRPLGTLSAWSLARHAWRKRAYLTLIERSHLARAAAIHVTSDAEGGAVKRLVPGVRVSTIPLGIEPSGLAPVRENAGATRGPLRLVFLSRLDPKKNLPVLFDAMGRLRRAGEAVELVVAGTGNPDYGAELERMVRERGLEEVVRFVGHLDGEAKRRLLEQADVFVLPSSHENFGIAVAEALEAGLPVVITDQVEIADEVRKAKAGVVVGLGSQELAGGIAQLRDGPTRAAFGANAARLAAERYTWPRAAEQLVELYTEVQTP